MAVTAEIIQKVSLPGIHSASGIEVLEESIFIAGDDSAWLYVLDSSWQPLRRISLFRSPVPAEDKIPKPLKPDLEAITSLPWQGETMLLLVGSGSQKNRQDAFLVNPRTDEVRRYSLAPLYDQLRTLQRVVGNRKLNLEGLAVSGEEIIFLQRGNVSGTNVLISYNLTHFTGWLEGGALPQPVISAFGLPSVEGYDAGFSGAATILSRPGLLLFTASVEATDDEILDGAMLGSFVGAIDLDSRELSPANLAPVLENGQAYKGKVESIAVWEEKPDGCTALAVTDSDGGESELLLLEIHW